VNTATETQKLSSDIFVDLSVSFSVKKTVPEVIATTNDLNIIEIMRVNRWEANTAIVHLSSEDFITEEVVSEETAITVCEVV